MGQGRVVKVERVVPNALLSTRAAGAHIMSSESFRSFYITIVFGEADPPLSGR